MSFTERSHRVCNAVRLHRPVPKNSLIDPRIASRSGIRLRTTFSRSPEQLVDVLVELAAAVGAFDLAVAEQVHFGSSFSCRISMQCGMSSPQLSPSEKWKA